MMARDAARFLSSFRPAAVNPNAHTVRGLKELMASIQEDRYTDPMVAAANREMLSGNARLEVVADVLGVDVEPIIVESDGTRPIIHVRTDIPSADSEIGKRVMVRSNRVAELDLSWSGEVLAGLDIDLSGLFEADEIDELAEQADTRLQDAGQSAERQLGDTRRQIKPVLYADEVAVFERAIRATGERNRGQALILICRAFLEQREQEAGQFDTAFESQLAL